MFWLLYITKTIHTGDVVVITWGLTLDRCLGDEFFSISGTFLSVIVNITIVSSSTLRPIHTRRSGLRFPQWAVSMQR